MKQSLLVFFLAALSWGGNDNGASSVNPVYFKSNPIHRIACAGEGFFHDLRGEVEAPSSYSFYFVGGKTPSWASLSVEGALQGLAPESAGNYSWKIGLQLVVGGNESGEPEEGRVVLQVIDCESSERRSKSFGAH